MTTFDIPAAEFARLVNYARPHCGTYMLLPLLNWIHFYEHDGRLYVEATDRYAAIRVESQVKAPEGFDLLIDRTDAAAVVSAFKARRGSTVVLTLTVDENRVTFRLSEGVIAAGLDLRITVAAQEGAYPKLGHLFDALADADAATEGMPTFNGDYLRRLPSGVAQFKSGGKGEPCGFYGGNEDDTAGWAVVIMPMRMNWGDLSQRWTSATTDEAVAS